MSVAKETQTVRGAVVILFRPCTVVLSRQTKPEMVFALSLRSLLCLALSPSVDRLLTLSSPSSVLSVHALQGPFTLSICAFVYGGRKISFGDL